MMPFDVVMFDWDGTLMDSTTAIAESLQAACNDLNLPVPSDEAARYIIGLGLQDAFEYVLPGLKSEQYEQVLIRYRAHFIARDRETSLFDGVTELLTELLDPGFLLAVATGKSRTGLERAFEASGLRRYFHTTCCADESQSKPHPEMLQTIMARLKVEPHRALMVGDTTHDLLMAQAAGVASVGVSYGAHPRQPLLDCTPLLIADDVKSLREWLFSAQHKR